MVLDLTGQNLSHVAGPLSHVADPFWPFVTWAMIVVPRSNALWGPSEFEELGHI